MGWRITTSAFEVQLCVENFKLMEQSILCHYYYCYLFWSKCFILSSHRSTKEEQILLLCFVLISKDKIQISWNLALGGTYRLKHLSPGIHAYIWTGNSPAPLHGQELKFTVQLACMCSETPQPAMTVSGFCLCSSAYSELCEKLREHLVQGRVLWTALVNGNTKGGCWQEGSWWKRESALSHPRSWVTVELALENLKTSNGLFLSASNQLCRTAFTRKNTKQIKRFPMCVSMYPCQK